MIIIFIDPMLIYPNIANMLGETVVDVNAICLDRSQTYILMIEQRQSATCTVINSAIARCQLPRVYDWGTKTVYFQKQTGGSSTDDKAFVGYIYFGKNFIFIYQKLRRLFYSFCRFFFFFC